MYSSQPSPLRTPSQPVGIPSTTGPSPSMPAVSPSYQQLGYASLQEYMLAASSGQLTARKLDSELAGVASSPSPLLPPGSSSLPTSSVPSALSALKPVYPPQKPMQQSFAVPMPGKAGAAPVSGGCGVPSPPATPPINMKGGMTMTPLAIAASPPRSEPAKRGPRSGKFAGPSYAASPAPECLPAPIFSDDPVSSASPSPAVPLRHASAVNALAKSLTSPAPASKGKTGGDGGDGKNKKLAVSPATPVPVKKQQKQQKQKPQHQQQPQHPQQQQQQQQQQGKKKRRPSKKGRGSPNQQSRDASVADQLRSVLPPNVNVSNAAGELQQPIRILQRNPSAVSEASNTSNLSAASEDLRRMLNIS